MNGNDIALDTNVAVQLMNGVEATVTFLCAFSKVFLPVPVIGELRYGAVNSSRSVENLAINADVATAQMYADVRFELKKRGTPIPENDIWIASICLQHAIPIATFDHHFSNVANLQIRRPSTSPDH